MSRGRVEWTISYFPDIYKLTLVRSRCITWGYDTIYYRTRKRVCIRIVDRLVRKTELVKKLNRCINVTKWSETTLIPTGNNKCKWKEVTLILCKSWRESGNRSEQWGGRNNWYRALTLKIGYAFYIPFVYCIITKAYNVRLQQMSQDQPLFIYSVCHESKRTY